jgi:hypothetical protein
VTTAWREILDDATLTAVDLHAIRRIRSPFYATRHPKRANVNGTDHRWSHVPHSQRNAVRGRIAEFRSGALTVLDADGERITHMTKQEQPR